MLPEASRMASLASQAWMTLAGRRRLRNFPTEERRLDDSRGLNGLRSEQKQRCTPTQY